MCSVASVANYLTMKLGRLAFSPPTSRHRKHRIVGIFNSVTQDKYKERIVNSLKTNGSKRIVIATSALSMGVNIPDIRYIVMYAPPPLEIRWICIKKLGELVGMIYHVFDAVLFLYCPNIVVVTFVQYYVIVMKSLVCVEKTLVYMNWYW